ncbi:peptidase, partial [Mycolicibacterium elephantis]
QLSFAPADCPGIRPSPAVSYCPATNTIAVDLDELTAMGTRADITGDGGLASGDNTAYSVLVSRFMQAVQHEH